MRFGFLIPTFAASILMLSGCGGEASSAVAPAAPSVPAPTLEELPLPYNEADLAAGKKLFGNKCGSCHYIQADKGDLMGPNLHGVFDRAVGAKPNYNYSPALKNFEHKQWSPDLIEQWLQAPQGFVPGTAMFFNGLKDPTERRNLIAYLMIASRQ
jgi:cytochrome c